MQRLINNYKLFPSLEVRLLLAPPGITPDQTAITDGQIMFSGVLDAICTKHGAGCVSRRISTSGPGQALYATLNLPADAAKALQAEAAEKGGFLIVPLPLSLELIPLQLLAPQWQPQSGDEPVERTFRVGGATGETKETLPSFLTLLASRSDQFPCITPSAIRAEQKAETGGDQRAVPGCFLITGTVPASSLTAQASYAWFDFAPAAATPAAAKPAAAKPGAAPATPASCFRVTCSRLYASPATTAPPA